MDGWDELGDVSENADMTEISETIEEVPVDTLEVSDVMNNVEPLENVEEFTEPSLEVSADSYVDSVMDSVAVEVPEFDDAPPVENIPNENIDTEGYQYNNLEMPYSELDELQDATNENVGEQLDDYSITDDSYAEDVKVLKRDETELWQEGNNAIENTLEVMRDDLRDKGIEDGPEMEEMIAHEKTLMQQELAQNIQGDFSNPYDGPEWQKVEQQTEQIDAEDTLEQIGENLPEAEGVSSVDIMDTVDAPEVEFDSAEISEDTEPIQEAEVIEELSDGTEESEVIEEVQNSAEESEIIEELSDSIEEPLDLNDADTLQDNVESPEVIVDNDNNQNIDSQHEDNQEDISDTHIEQNEPEAEQIDDIQQSDEFKDMQDEFEVSVVAGIDGEQPLVSQEMTEGEVYEIHSENRPQDLSEEVDSVSAAELSEAEEVSEVRPIDEMDKWLEDINPNFDPFDINSPYCNNCGSCAYAVYQRLEGNNEICATAENIGYNEQMEALTGMEQVSMSPQEIETRLLEQGDGAHAIIGIDRVTGPGHWFNAANIGGKVVAIDGQSGEITDWPGVYGNVKNWEMSIKKEIEEV